MLVLNLGDLLQRVQLKHSAMERCENISIASVNSVCTEPAYSNDDCNVRVFFPSLATNRLLRFIRGLEISKPYGLC